MEKDTEKTKPHPLHRIHTGDKHDQRVKSQELSPLSKRDSGYASPGNVLQEKSHFTFGDSSVMWDTETTSEDQDQLFEDEPQGASTPVSQPIAIPRRSRSQRRSGANAPLYQEVPSPLGLSPSTARPAPLLHRFSTGSFPQEFLDHATGRQCDCREVGTQTTHIAGQMMTHAIRGELVFEHGPLCGAYGITRRISFVGNAVEQIRLGHGDVEDEATRQRTDSMPLPDLVPVSRGRAMSVPALRRIRTESEIGQELRRISDEFHLSYRSEYQVPEREPQDQQASSFPGTGHHNVGFFTRIRHFFSQRRLVAPQPQRQRRYTGDGLVHHEQSEPSDSEES
ncbi:uncharacterized protein LOC106166313 [Lingula anatina]|uniref:Uncharacterized protein LOC106166313 n=1 Tax=Lingula anatina TaxID=7574 RepID=A0A1S3IS10_LINAN|nr:uncharacterized protein LOC106166313 [Lingula anatina]XP_013400305.1 uncharacterized protein LOC106166313 [Lingula anatina]XP_013400312.1 uncharacterized protein LOC106166313 [Lingula anatina]XP_013400319.1 uncharacterized protein LOC106166313 [Lingula anatina]XP_013400327.1 uncharacterized protein LOC106166313 [Lingula anatina]XP_013400336.1 uncharacterized protein LOC106166313 [Lingula anatina]XP_013400343.1 uncharacterized protein LOC106166313 [Lingula anatina]XP_013400350.1 uncharacte|eukprot:XP_013400297.1 uncharacterized protein LOC106166313 [Lingula anatina]